MHPAEITLADHHPREIVLRRRAFEHAVGKADGGAVRWRPRSLFREAVDEAVNEVEPLVQRSLLQRLSVLEPSPVALLDAAALHLQDE